MTEGNNRSESGPPPDRCGLRVADTSGVVRVGLSPAPSPRDYREAMRLAAAEVSRRLGGHRLLSWYDRDRDFEAPQHASECHAECAIPGDVDYGLNQGATLEVRVDEGRFLFFYLPLDAELAG